MGRAGFEPASFTAKGSGLQPDATPPSLPPTQRRARKSVSNIDDGWSGRQDSNLRSPRSKRGGDGQTPPRPVSGVAVRGYGWPCACRLTRRRGVICPDAKMDREQIPCFFRVTLFAIAVSCRVEFAGYRLENFNNTLGLFPGLKKLRPALGGELAAREPVWDGEGWGCDRVACPQNPVAWWSWALAVAIAGRPSPSETHTFGSLCDCRLTKR